MASLSGLGWGGHEVHGSILVGSVFPKFLQGHFKTPIGGKGGPILWPLLNYEQGFESEKMLIEKNMCN